MNYADDMKIDASGLDIECLDQPALMLKYAEIAAEKEQALDDAKEALEFCTSELDMEIRNFPEKFGVAKVTDNSVKAAIPLQEDYKTAMSNMIRAKFEYKVASGAAKAVDARKTMLETLVKLHGQQYFAGPSVPRDIAKEWEAKQTQNTSNEIVSRRTRRNK